jgi:hypothetical protein
MTIDLKAIKEWLDVITAVIVVVGVPLGFWKYYRTVQKEQRDREYGTYNALDEKFMEFQRLCLDHPELDTFDVQDMAPKPLSAEQQKKELIAFTMLFSIFERAFLMYQDQSTEIKRAQWSGWDSYIKGFCKRANFQSAWKASGTTFDTRFESYISHELAGAGSGATSPPVIPTPVTP